MGVGETGMRAGSGSGPPASRGLVAAEPGRQLSAMIPVHERELQRLRTMTAAEKLATMQALWHQARALTAAGVRTRHPGWSTREVEEEVRRIYLRDTS